MKVVSKGRSKRKELHHAQTAEVIDDNGETWHLVKHADGVWRDVRGVAWEL